MRYKLYFFIFNTNPRFSLFLLHVRCKSRVIFIRRSFRDGIIDKMIKNVNRHLKDVMSKDLHFAFVWSYKAVVKGGTYRIYLFAKKDNGLHLNTEGSDRLRFFFLSVISIVD